MRVEACSIKPSLAAPLQHDMTEVNGICSLSLALKSSLQLQSVASHAGPQAPLARQATPLASTVDRTSEYRPRPQAEPRKRSIEACASPYQHVACMEGGRVLACPQLVHHGDGDELGEGHTRGRSCLAGVGGALVHSQR